MKKNVISKAQFVSKVQRLLGIYESMNPKLRVTPAKDGESVYVALPFYRVKANSGPSLIEVVFDVDIQRRPGVDPGSAFLGEFGRVSVTGYVPEVSGLTEEDFRATNITVNDEVYCRYITAVGQCQQILTEGNLVFADDEVDYDLK